MMRLVQLSLVFMLLSVLAVGGGTAVLPEMQYMTVDKFHWLTDAQFRSIYSIGQVAPGPNMLMVLLIGYHLAGWSGMTVVGLAFFLPDCLITLFVNRWWVHLGSWPWRVSIQRGLAPVAIGLMLSGTYAIARLAIINPLTLLIGLAVFAILMWRHQNAAMLVLLGGTVYMVLT